MKKEELCEACWHYLSATNVMMEIDPDDEDLMKEMYKVLKVLPSNLNLFRLTPTKMFMKGLKDEENRTNLEKCYEAMINMISDVPDFYEDEESQKKALAIKKARVFRHFAN